MCLKVSPIFYATLLDWFFLPEIMLIYDEISWYYYSSLLLRTVSASCIHFSQSTMQTFWSVLYHRIRKDHLRPLQSLEYSLALWSFLQNTTVWVGGCFLSPKWFWSRLHSYRHDVERGIQLMLILSNPLLGCLDSDFVPDILLIVIDLVDHLLFLDELLVVMIDWSFNGIHNLVFCFLVS